jgi:UDP-glucuronate 4-epimerase
MKKKLDNMKHNFLINKMTILVTGAAGFIGSHVSKAHCLTEGISVIGFDNLNDYYDVTLKQDQIKKPSA